MCYYWMCCWAWSSFYIWSKYFCTFNVQNICHHLRQSVPHVLLLCYFLVNSLYSGTKYSVSSELKWVVLCTHIACCSIEAWVGRALIYVYITILPREASCTGTHILVWSKIGTDGSGRTGLLMAAHINVLITELPSVALITYALIGNSAWTVVRSWEVIHIISHYFMPELQTAILFNKLQLFTIRSSFLVDGHLLILKFLLTDSLPFTRPVYTIKHDDLGNQFCKKLPQEMQSH